MAGRLRGKVCVITGAGSGMGREAAILFSEEGASVCVADVDGAAAEQTAALCPGSFAQEVDVAAEASVAAMMDATASRYGGIDVLYNNAGISPGDDASVLETSVEAWDRVQAVNTKGVFLCCKHGIPHLLDRVEHHVGGADPRTLGGEQRRRLATHPAAGAGDHAHLPVQPSHEPS